ncbi:BZ3500_MvSof-1268-A1-R1_Chr7-1g09166 [Microbotryum saponariae]|uniref:serine--tRNA ligase n=1 Tax=Microbotryum saponariae TaxID=289078 RepID=A0A2X0KWK7_9BASI|nr:BZ3501_MvSof-1269-A2-R1_Chr7-1g08871 [Microbotryum saponariae]SDA02921.1 BZ3500_MvSof-1268-A1-R1_Chr7-1g09166 [Microbotryum saponariae]
MLQRLATASTRRAWPSGPCTCSHTRRQVSSSSSSPSPSSSPATSSTRPTRLGPPIPDLYQVLHDPEAVKLNLKRRNSPVPPSVVDELRNLEHHTARLRSQLQSARERRNQLTLLNKDRKTMTDASREEAKTIKERIKQLEPDLNEHRARMQLLALSLPNRSHPSSPVGGEDQAKLIKYLGPKVASNEQRDSLKDHTRLSATDLDWTDFPTASLISGNSWPMLKNTGAKLELALTQYALSIALKNKFELVLPPDVVRSEIAERCGFQPRDQGEAQQTYFLGDGGERPNQNDLCLVGTAEIPLVSMNAGQTFRAEQLPRRIVGLGRAFRAEAGARGQESRGLYRVHQFSKIEFVIVSPDDQSQRLLDELVRLQIEILSGLGLSLRVLEMPTEELGVSAQRKVDIEAWMPGRGKWGEVSSASNCTDWQARRLLMRYRPSGKEQETEGIRKEQEKELEDLNIPTPAALEATALYPSQFENPVPASSSGGGNVWCHTLNATAAAIPRLIVAIMENGVVLDQEGKVEKVRLPGCLKRWWLEGGKADEGMIEWVNEGEALSVSSE